MRDPHKPKEYFETLLTYSADILPRFEAKIADPNTEPLHRERLRYAVFTKRLHHLIASYSRGDTIESLREQFPPLVDALADYQAEGSATSFQFQDLDDYVHCLWLLSLCDLLKLPSLVVERLRVLTGNEQHDALFDHDDQSFQDHPHYPSELVNWARAQTI